MSEITERTGFNPFQELHMPHIRFPRLTDAEPVNGDPDEYDEATQRMQDWFIRHDKAGKWLCIGVVIVAAIVMACGALPR